MLRIALQNVIHRKLRFALTAVAVALGVAFVSGTYMLTDTMHSAFTTFFTQADSKMDLVVQSPSKLSTSVTSWGDREPLPQGMVSTVRSVPGVADAVGYV